MDEPSGEEQAAPRAAPRRKAAERRRAARPASRPSSRAGAELPPALPPLVLDDEGRERPPFLAAFPAHPELDRLVAAYQVGNYARVRAEAPALAARAEDAAVREAALELHRRLAPDPLARYLLLASVTLLVALAVWALGHGH